MTAMLTTAGVMPKRPIGSSGSTATMPTGATLHKAVEKADRVIAMSTTVASRRAATTTSRLDYSSPIMAPTATATTMDLPTVMMITVPIRTRWTQSFSRQ